MINNRKITKYRADRRNYWNSIFKMRQKTFWYKYRFGQKVTVLCFGEILIIFKKFWKLNKSFTLHQFRCKSMRQRSILNYWHFPGQCLVTYSVLDLGKEQYYQRQMAVKPPNFLLKSHCTMWLLFWAPIATRGALRTSVFFLLLLLLLLLQAYSQIPKKLKPSSNLRGYQALYNNSISIA